MRIFKYIFYLILIAVLYIVISAMYNGKVNTSSTVSEVGVNVYSDAKKIAADSVNAIEKAVK